MLIIQVEGLSAPALVNTGATVFVIREAFRRLPKKVLTPPIVAALKTASGALISKIACCDAWITIRENEVLASFVVISDCPHGVFLGMNFLFAHSALIDYATGQIELAVTDAYELPDLSPHRLCSASTTHLEPSSAIYV